MDIKKQVTNWVENKVGDLIANDLKDKIQDENCNFDVESYVDDLLNAHFTETDLQNLQQEILNDYFNYSLNNYESDISTEGDTYSHDSFEFEQNEYQSLPTEELIQNLHSKSEEVQIKSLQALEASAEDLINQVSWNTIKKKLQNILETNGNRKIIILVLKIFQRFLMCHSKPQLVCEGFLCLAEIILFFLDRVNSDGGNVSFEEIYDLKENKWLHSKTAPVSRKSPNDRKLKNRKLIDAEVLIKSMFLLIECQKQMPEKWIRFSEKRLREVIFSFVHLLASTLDSEDGKLSGLHLLSVLNPRATWCRHWCHTAVGRSLLCSALSKYKNFFTHIVENVLINMKVKRSDHSHKTGNQTFRPPEPFTPKPREINRIQKESKTLDVAHSDVERSKHVRSAPTGFIEGSDRQPDEKANNRKKTCPEWFFENIPSKIVTQALFCHCMSFVVWLIQFQNGRSLFPVQTSSRKRLLSVLDFTVSMLNYLENFQYFECKVKGIMFTQAYRRLILEMTRILENVKTNIHSSRMSADRLSQR